MTRFRAKRRFAIRDTSFLVTESESHAPTDLLQDSSDPRRCSFCAGGSRGDGRATVRLWPGTSPCDTTLQACIDRSANDDTVQIQSNGPIDENLNVNKTLSLVAAAGFRPAFDVGFGITA
jgi:hypothetical protein